MANNVWKVKEITEGGVTRKVWAKEATLYRVGLDGNSQKQWQTGSISKVVEDGSQHKSWEPA